MTESSKGTKVKNPTFYIADSLGLPAVGQYQTNYKPPAVQYLQHNHTKDNQTTQDVPERPESDQRITK